MQNVLMLFGHPAEPAAFDSHFKDNFSPLLRAIPNVRKIEINQVAGAAHGDSPYYLIVSLQFDSDDALQDGLNSEAGQAMASGMDDFVTGGVSVLFAQAVIESMGAP
ncbi:MAG: EthD family reductase [Chloroflexi bacterium]|nr:EthD family reductase [Chloroflexota bacterium]